MEIATERTATLADLGLPHIVIYQSGYFYDVLSKTVKVPQKDGTIEFGAGHRSHGQRFSVRQLVSYYFEAPWSRSDCCWYRNLSCIGASRYFITSKGEVYSTFTWEYMVWQKTVDGYNKVLMTFDSGKSNSIGIHRLVALAFIPNPEGKNEVNHKDCNKDNNCVENLEWTWSYENMEHALKNGLRKFSTSDEQIHEICKRLERGDRVVDIMKDLNVPKHLVLGIKSGCHNRISKLYNIPRNKHF